MLMYAIAAILTCCVLIGLRDSMPWIGTVSRVVDGDSLEAPRRGETLRIRIVGMDAPEWKQPHGRKAQAAMSALVTNRRVLFVPMGRDVYGRVLCRVVANRRCVSMSMTLAGHAWGDGPLTRLLSLAPRVMRRGLWADPAPIRPGLWRSAQPTH